MVITRRCRCGVVINDDVLSIINHVTDPDHAERLKAIGVFTHNHSYLWVDAQDHPVERDALGARRYFRSGCDACENEIEPES